MLERRQFITGLISLVAAPAIIRSGSLMPVKVMEPISAQDLWNRYINEVLSVMSNNITKNIMYGTTDETVIKLGYEQGLYVDTIEDFRKISNDK